MAREGIEVTPRLAVVCAMTDGLQKGVGGPRLSFEVSPDRFLETVACLTIQLTTARNS